MKKKLLIIFNLFLLLFFIAPTIILAAGTEATEPRFIIPDLQVKLPGFSLASIGSVEDGVPWIAQYVSFMYTYGFKIATIFAAVVIMVGGAIWLTDGGSGSRVNKAKEIIIGGLSGLILISAAYVLLAQINPKLVDFEEIPPQIIERETVYAAQPNPSNSACVLELNDGEFPGISGEPIISGPEGLAAPRQAPLSNSLTGSQSCSTQKGGYKKNGLYFAGVGQDFSLTRPTDPRIYCPAADKNSSAQDFKNRFFYNKNDSQSVKDKKKAALAKEIVRIASSFTIADSARGREITSYNCAYPNNGKMGSYGAIVRECPTNAYPNGRESTVLTRNSIHLVDCGGWVGYVYSCAGLGIPVGPISTETTFDISLHQPEATKAKVLASKSADFSKAIKWVQPGEFFGITKTHAMLRGFNDDFYECGHNKNKSESTGCTRKSLIKDFNQTYKNSLNMLITFPLDYIIEETSKNFYQ